KVRPVVKQWLEEEQAENHPKQRYTAGGIYKRLVEEHDYLGSESSIRRLLAQLRQKEKEVYIPLAFEPGNNAQCDWGEATIYLNGEQAKVQVFCMRLTNCRKSFVMAFPHQRQEAFFEGHVYAFNWFGGVPLTITYDNLKTAVSKILQGRTRQEQTAFISFRSHYLLRAVFCNAGRGMKGAGRKPGGLCPA
ncbi:MAG: IS21 family transposase, partial [Desulfocucumaceae bacterium]